MEKKEKYNLDSSDFYVQQKQQLNDTSNTLKEEKEKEKVQVQTTRIRNHTPLCSFIILQTVLIFS